MTEPEVKKLVRILLHQERERLARLVREVVNAKCSQCGAHNEHDVCDSPDLKRLADMVEGDE